MNDLSIGLSIVAGLLYAIGYMFYYRNILKNDPKPNPVSWGIWAALSLLSTGSYFTATGDWWKNVIPLMNIALCFGAFVLLVIHAKRKKLTWVDWTAIIMGIVVIVVWISSKSALQANMLVQVVIIIGFIPTWKNVWSEPRSEQRTPWLIWTTSFFIATIVVLLRWKEGHWYDLVYPINCVVLHLSVPVICRLRTNRIITMGSTARGFASGEFKDWYGLDCSIQKSSNAMVDCIWLGVNENRMLLDQKMVAKLLPLLQKFTKTGDL